MIKHVTPWAASCVWLFASALFAQTTSGVDGPNIAGGPPNPGDRSALTNSETSQEIKDLHARIAELERMVKNAATPMPSPDPGQAEEVRELAARVRMLEQSISSLNSSVNTLMGTVGERSAFNGQLPILSKMRTDANFRDEMKNVIQGKLIFNNLTGTTQPVLINGNRWRVPAGQSHLMVPFGTVYAQLPWEGTKPWSQWRFVGDEQQLTINIGF